MRSRDHGMLVIFSLVFITVGPLLYASEPGVARVSLINGDVTSMRGDSGDWVALTVNAPLVSGDRIATARGSRSEVQLDFANILRLGQESDLRIADLSQSHIQVQLSQGIVNLTVLKGNEADVEIDTPNVAVRPMKEGRYRIQVNERGETEVIVRQGEAEVFTSEGSTRVKKNDMAVVRGTKDSAEYRTVDAPGRDNWDEWNEDRDDMVRNARSLGHTSPYYTGVQDLDRYGRWTYIPGYDWCWAPIGVDPYWAPYRQGRWVWEPYWGWTWVSYEPWGWAPYHYGRWFCQANVWYWWPGPVHRHYRPLWAPAFVTFFGFGAGRFNFSFGFGFGYSSLGWLPVGPGDYYYPWYGRYRYRYNSVNIVNVRNVYNIYGDGAIGPLGRGRPHGSNFRDVLNNPRLRNSLTVVQTGDFVSGRARYSRLDESRLRDAQLVAGNPPAVPTRESLRSSDRSVTPVRSVNSERSNQMFSRRTPPEVRNSFSDGERSMREMVQRTDPMAVSGRARSERGSTATDNGGSNRTQSRGVEAGGRGLNQGSTQPAGAVNSNRVEGGRSSGQGERNLENRGSAGGWQSFSRGREESRRSGSSPETQSNTGRGRIESGRRTADQPPAGNSATTQGRREFQTLRSGDSRGNSGSRGNSNSSRGNSSSERRSNESVAPSRSPEGSGSSTPSRGSSSREGRGNRGPSNDQSSSSFMSFPRGESSSPRSSGPSVITIPGGSSRGTASPANRSQAGVRPERQAASGFMTAPRVQSDSVRSNGPTVITIPRRSNTGDVSGSSRSNRGSAGRDFQQAPRTYRQETPSYQQASPTYRQESSPRYSRQQTPSYRQETSRYQSQPRYAAPSRSWSGAGSGSGRSAGYARSGGDRSSVQSSRSNSRSGGSGRSRGGR